MSYLGFARKYRPRRFEEVVGQVTIAQTLQNAITSNRVHHAYIFCGSRGVGKTSMARIFSKALNCEQGPTPNPCGQCISCRNISQGEDIDVLEIDGASNRGIEEIRNIKESVKYLPTHSRFKIFIIDEVHMLTQAAFNALLKILEEPPSYVKFIFATTHVSALPDTILSRCQRFDFKKIQIEDITSHLMHIAKAEQIEVSEDILRKIAQAAGGALRDSLVIFDQVVAYSGNQVTEAFLSMVLGDSQSQSQKIVECIGQKQVTELLQTISEFFENGGDPGTLIDTLAQKFRDLLLITVSPEGKNFVDHSQQYLHWLEKQKPLFGAEFLMQAIHHIVESRSLIQRDLMGRIIVETVLLKILRLESLLPLKTMLERLERLDSAGAIPTSSSSSLQATPSPQAVTPPRSITAGMSSSTPARAEKPTQPAATPAQPIPPTTPSEPSKTTSNYSAAAVSKPSNQQKPDLAPTPSRGHQRSGSLESRWQHFLQRLGKERGNIAYLLKTEAKIQQQQHKIRVILKPEHHFTLRLLSLPDNQTLIKQLSQEIFGETSSLEFELAQESQEGKKKQKAVEVAQNDPLVLQCLELFSGRISHVTESNDGS